MSPALYGRSPRAPIKASSSFRTSQYCYRDQTESLCCTALTVCGHLPLPPPPSAGKAWEGESLCINPLCQAGRQAHCRGEDDDRQREAAAAVGGGCFFAFSSCSLPLCVTASLCSSLSVFLSLSLSPSACLSVCLSPPSD